MDWVPPFWETVWHNMLLNYGPKAKLYFVHVLEEFVLKMRNGKSCAGVDVVKVAIVKLRIKSPK